MSRSEDKHARQMFMGKVGLNPDQLTGWRVKWKGLKQNASKRGSDFTLTFEDYIQIAVDSGLNHFDQVGRRKGEYGMARIGDIGPYSYGNCRFLTTEDNIAERTLNGGTASQTLKLSKRFRCVSPDGNIVEGFNLTKFQRDNGFANDSLSGVANGKYRQYLGWVCEYIKD